MESRFSVVAAGAWLFARFNIIQKITLIKSATQDPAGHFTINFSRRKSSPLTSIPGFSSLEGLRGIQQLTFDPNINHAVVDALLRPMITQPKPSQAVNRVNYTHGSQVHRRGF
jgi:hypothetical protein